MSTVLIRPDDFTNDLKNPARPTFLFGVTPPRDGTSPEKAREILAKFCARSSVLATDGFIVYDIQDEKGRVEAERPFPFRKTLDPSWYGSLFPEVAGKHCIVYKSVVEESVEKFDQWIDTARLEHGHLAFNLVGAPTSKLQYKGPSLEEAGHMTRVKPHCDFGCVCIAERHGKRNEALAMTMKGDWGAEWFISQGVYSAGPIINLLNDYGDLCRARGIVPKKVVITFAPCGRQKTMTFIKWLGMAVPDEVEQRIFAAESPVAESVKILSEILQTILEQTSTSGVPLGINVESLSIFKEEIDAAHTLFQKLQALLLNHRGSPWAVRWFLVHEIRPSRSHDNITQLQQRGMTSASGTIQIPASALAQGADNTGNASAVIPCNHSSRRANECSATGSCGRDDLRLERTLMLSTSVLSAISTALFVYSQLKHCRSGGCSKGGN